MLHQDMALRTRDCLSAEHQCVTHPAAVVQLALNQSPATLVGSPNESTARRLHRYCSSEGEILWRLIHSLGKHHGRSVEEISQSSKWLVLSLWSTDSWAFQLSMRIIALETRNIWAVHAHFGQPFLTILSSCQQSLTLQSLPKY